MTDLTTNPANWTETTLTATFGPTDLTATVASTAGFTSPCYVVFEQSDPAQREIVLMDGTFTGTTLVASVIGNRYLTGSAAGSGLTHPSGTTVTIAPVAQHVEDLHDRIDADETVNSTHRSDTSNPHSVTAAQAGAATSTHTHDADIATATLTGANQPIPNGAGSFTKVELNTQAENTDPALFTVDVAAGQHDIEIVQSGMTVTIEAQVRFADISTSGLVAFAILEDGVAIKQERRAVSAADGVYDMNLSTLRRPATATKYTLGVFQTVEAGTLDVVAGAVLTRLSIARI